MNTVKTVSIDILLATTAANSAHKFISTNLWLLLCEDVLRLFTSQLCVTFEPCNSRKVKKNLKVDSIEQIFKAVFTQKRMTLR